MNDIKRKVRLYVISLGLLFVFFIVLTFNFTIAFDEIFTSAGLWKLVQENPLALISLLMILYSIYAYKSFEFDLKGSTEIPFEIIKIKSVNYEHLTFLATYVVPLISFDFGSIRQIIVLSILLAVMGIIYVKTDLFYANPSLALLGYHIYEVDGNFKNGKREGIVLITRRKLAAGEKCHYVKLDDRIYYVSKGKK